MTAADAQKWAMSLKEEGKKMYWSKDLTHNGKEGFKSEYTIQFDKAYGKFVMKIVHVEIADSQSFPMPSETSYFDDTQFIAFLQKDEYASQFAVLKD